MKTFNFRSLILTIFGLAFVLFLFFISFMVAILIRSSITSNVVVLPNQVQSINQWFEKIETKSMFENCRLKKAKNIFFIGRSTSYYSSNYDRSNSTESSMVEVLKSLSNEKRCIIHLYQHDNFNLATTKYILKKAISMGLTADYLVFENLTYLTETPVLSNARLAFDTYSRHFFSISNLLSKVDADKKFIFFEKDKNTGPTLAINHKIYTSWYMSEDPHFTIEELIAKLGSVTTIKEAKILFSELHSIYYRTNGVGPNFFDRYDHPGYSFKREWLRNAFFPLSFVQVSSIVFSIKELQEFLPNELENTKFILAPQFMHPIEDEKFFELVKRDLNIKNEINVVKINHQKYLNNSKNGFLELLGDGYHYSSKINYEYGEKIFNLIR